MQIFCPYPSPLDCAKALWNDKLRYNKQCIECTQILNAIDGAKAWRNHPVTKMYKEHKVWLTCYMLCLNYYKLYKKSVNEIDKKSFYTSAEIFSNRADVVRPPFLTEEFCYQHKRRLYTKSPELYSLFAKYGKSDENWYFVDGRIVKYINGKKL